MKAISSLLFALVLICTNNTGHMLWAQNRLFLDFSNANEPCLVEGVRIKQASLISEYWVLTERAELSGTSNNTMGVAFVTPTSLPSTPHAHYTFTGGNVAAYDFVPEANTIMAVGDIDNLSMSLLPVQSSLPVAEISHSYSNLLISSVPYLTEGRCILRYSNDYIVAADARANNGLIQGTVVAAINTTTKAVSWLQFIPSDVGTQTYVNDMIYNAVDGCFTIVGNVVNTSSNNSSGTLIRVNTTGTFLGKTIYPVGTGNLWFNGLSRMPGNTTRYAVSGTFQPGTGPKSVFFGTFTNVGVPVRSFVYSAANGVDDVQAYRHTQIAAGSEIGSGYSEYLVLAGDITHNNTGGIPYKSGTLMWLRYPNNEENGLCSDWLTAWKEYPVYDNFFARYINSSIRDVCPKLSNPIVDVAAVGHTEAIETPLGSKPGYLIWMDTYNTLSATGDHCWNVDVQHQCLSLALDYTTSSVLAVSATADNGTFNRSRNIDPDQYSCSDVYVYAKANTEDENLSAKSYANDITLNMNEAGVGTLSLSLRESDNLTIELFDATGVKVKDIASQYVQSGTHAIQVDCSGITSGMYALRVQGQFFNKSLMLPVVR